MSRAKITPEQLMRAIAGVLIFGLFCGCANIPFAGKKGLSRAKKPIDQQELRIRELEATLAQREAQIKEKDEHIRQLKDQLRSLGVF